MLKLNKMTTRDLVFLSLFIALNVVLTRFAAFRFAIGGVEGVRIGIGALPVIFASILFGPLAGGIVGALGDIIGFYTFGIGPYMPHFTLTAFLTGFIPGLILIQFDGDSLTFTKLLAAIGIGQLTTTVLLTPFFLNMLFSIPYAITIPANALSQAVSVPLYAYLIKVMMAKGSHVFPLQPTSNYNKSG